MYRTYKDGSTLSGGIVFSGDVADPTKYEWETSSEYPRGIYVENGNIGVAGMTIKGDGVNSATALVTSHRNRSYVHLLSCIVDGVDKAQTTYGLLAESGGLIEQGGVDVKNCGTLLSALGGASSISHTHDGTRGLLSGGDTAVGLGPGTFAALYMLQTGTGDVSVVSSNTIGANLAANSTLFLRGADASNHLVFGSLINTADSATLDCLFTSLDGATTVKNGDMRLSNSFYGRQITLKGGSRLRLVNAQGYLRGMSGSPAPDINKSTQSAIFTEGTLTSVSWAEPETTWTVTGDNETVSVSDGVDFYDLRGDSAAYVGCEIDATGVNEGREITVWGAGFPIEFLGGGSNMDIQSGSEFRLGNPAGFSNVYTGAKFKMASGRWRCVGLGAPR